MIDWPLAERIALSVSGEPPRPPLISDPVEVAKRCERLASEYTRLVPAKPLPAPEIIGRRAWASANLRSTRPLLDPLSGRVGENLGPLAPALRTATGYVLAAEIGVVVGFLAQRVLGQYEVMLLEPDAPARLLLVAPNLEEAVGALHADRDELFTWVMLHEVTHALQFGGVPWLREHVAGLLRELIASLDVSIDVKGVLRIPSAEDLRTLVETVRQGDLISLVSTPEQRELVDRIQATMAVIEGHAEHVMDAVGVTLIPSLDRLREAMEHRRSRTSPIARLVGRLIGLELKLRQYRQGKRFCDTVVEREGIGALNRVWTGPEALPTAAEIEDPAAWLRRTAVPAVTK